MNATKLLYLVICGAGPAPQAGKLISSAKQRGWDVRVILTPAAQKQLQGSDLTSFSPFPHLERHAGNQEGIIIAPATFNTINKLANGISDNPALDFLSSSIGHVPTVILPFVNKGYAARHPFITSLCGFQDEGILILKIAPHEAGTGDGQVEYFPWDEGLDMIDRLM
jgi:hypothetical protein